MTPLIVMARRVLTQNSTTILTGLGVSGTLSTAYLAARASFTAARVIDKSEFEGGVSDEWRQRLKERSLLVWKLYIPTAASGVITIGCIVASTRIGAKRAAAAYSLLSVSEKAFTEYREKVVEQIGVQKEQKVRDEIAQDHVTNTQTVIVSGAGTVQCFESHTGRYFLSDMETIRKAVNTINAKMLREDEATLSDFYYLIGLPYTSYSSGTGWRSDKLLELYYSTALNDGGIPCITFEYNYVKPL